MNNSKKLVFIDYLRSFSMLYIVGYWHLFSYTSAFPEYWNPITERITLIALGLFTFISGFLNGKSAMKSLRITDFYIKRLARIYPLYLVAVILFFIYRLNNGVTSLKSLLFVSMLYGPRPLTLWFITMIMLFYLTTPFLVRLAGNFPKYIFTVVSLIAFLIILMFTVRTVDNRLILYFPCFCVGIYCAVNGVENQLANIKYAMMFLVIGLIFTGTGTRESLMQIPFIVSSSYLIFVASYRSREIFSKISLISFLSYSSYAMYLFHRPIYITLKAFFFPKTGVFQIFYLVGFCLLVVALASWGLQRINDKVYTIANNWLQRMSLSRQR